MVKKNFVLLFLTLIAHYRLNATHIVGGELNYRYLGNNVYEIRLVVYRDCFNGVAPFDNPANVAIYLTDGTYYGNVSIPLSAPQSVPNVINSPCFPPPTNICYEVAVYSSTTVLPLRAGGYVLAYQRCCRNGSIVNIQNVDATGATYMAAVPGIEVVSVNSNPVFNNWPPTFICKDAPFTFDHSAFDYEGDSLVYEMCSPLEGGSRTDPMPVPAAPPPYDSVIFRPPYSISNMLGGDPIRIDHQTGILTATPNSLGQFVYGVCVKEYRNGILIGQTRRDFQVNVVSCPQITVASIFSPTIACGSLAANFVNTSYNAVAYHWDFGDLGTLADTSGSRNPVYTYPDTGTYSVTLIAVSGINTSCSDTVTGIARVYPRFNSSFSLQNIRCSPDFQFLDQSFGVNGLPDFWLWNFGDNSISGVQNPSHTYARPGIYTVSLISSTDSACYDTVSTSISVLRNPIASFTPVIDTCNYSVQLRNTSLFADSTLWNFGDQSQSVQYSPFHQYNQSGNYSIYLQVSTDSSCTDSTFIPIYIPPLPEPAFTFSTGICDSIVTFANNSLLSSSWLWDFGDGTTSVEEQPVHTYELSGKIPVQLTAISDYGCEVKTTDSVLVISYKEARFDASLDSCSGVVSFDNVTKNGLTYLWSFGDSSYSSLPQPVHLYSENKEYTIQLIVNDETACRSVFSLPLKYELPLGELLFLPNTFTPNGDGINDFFNVLSYKPCSNYSLFIYNRWGQMIYRADDALNASWDGTYEGRQCPNDIYVFLLKGNGKERKGMINLLR